MRQPFSGRFAARATATSTRIIGSGVGHPLCSQVLAVLKNAIAVVSAPIDPPVVILDCLVTMTGRAGGRVSRSCKESRSSCLTTGDSATTALPECANTREDFRFRAWCPGAERGRLPTGSGIKGFERCFKPL